MLMTIHDIGISTLLQDVGMAISGFSFIPYLVARLELFFREARLTVLELEIQ